MKLTWVTQAHHYELVDERGGILAMIDWWADMLIIKVYPTPGVPLTLPAVRDTTVPQAKELVMCWWTPSRLVKRKLLQ